ncbi:MAG: Uma2 family endonuclease [Chloroflexaceae bacterium]|nr:Uma2 family endonuclease [Chloroflexaceae bacterium]
MTPAPGTLHQASAVLFTTHLVIHVQFAGLGHVFAAPYEVALPFVEGVSQPDVVVVLNANLPIITDRRIVGVPDLIVEILSSDTAHDDQTIKRTRYAQAGIPEYWMADLSNDTVDLLVLEDGIYHSSGVFGGQVALPSRVIPGFPVPVEHLFPGTGMGTAGRKSHTLALEMVEMGEFSPRRRPQFGSASGLVIMADDFDAPLEDFQGYQS